mmetsp:Transcript_28448/g.72495  ORF Transcript_28448/g.72495 Transcript_28448/m.72495 type:complete len:260 (-) Transcript_28448:776-1555(-)
MSASICSRCLLIVISIFFSFSFSVFTLFFSSSICGTIALLPCSKASFLSAFALTSIMVSSSFTTASSLLVFFLMASPYTSTPAWSFAPSLSPPPPPLFSTFLERGVFEVGGAFPADTACCKPDAAGEGMPSFFSSVCKADSIRTAASATDDFTLSSDRSFDSATLLHSLCSRKSARASASLFFHFSTSAVFNSNSFSLSLSTTTISISPFLTASVTPLHKSTTSDIKVVRLVVADEEDVDGEEEAEEGRPSSPLLLLRW